LQHIGGEEEKAALLLLASSVSFPLQLVLGNLLLPNICVFTLRIQRLLKVFFTFIAADGFVILILASPSQGRL
jgi:hypothetical protein